MCQPVETIVPSGSGVEHCEELNFQPSFLGPWPTEYLLGGMIRDDEYSGQFLDEDFGTAWDLSTGANLGGVARTDGFFHF
jgi:hypothetical protein